MEEFDLARFVKAQADVYAQALSELHRGYKSTHWMWFIFPQLKGLGHSPAASYYGITGLAEAKAYLAHPVLGPRLLETANAILAHAGKEPEAILGNIDAKKLRSCMTLFREAAPEIPVFDGVLSVFYQGKPDLRTLQLLEHP